MWPRGGVREVCHVDAERGRDPAATAALDFRCVARAAWHVRARRSPRRPASVHAGAEVLTVPHRSTPARRRLMRDFKRMQSDPPEGVNGAPCDNDIMKWHAVIFG